LPFLMRHSKDPLSTIFSSLNWRLIAEYICLPHLLRPTLTRETPIETNFGRFFSKKWSLFCNPLLSTLLF
jgi:hypothetical protein